MGTAQVAWGLSILVSSPVLFLFLNGSLGKPHGWHPEVLLGAGCIASVFAELFMIKSLVVFDPDGHPRPALSRTPMSAKASEDADEAAGSSDDDVEEDTEPQFQPPASPWQSRWVSRGLAVFVFFAPGGTAGGPRGLMLEHGKVWWLRHVAGVSAIKTPLMERKYVERRRRSRKNEEMKKICRKEEEVGSRMERS